MTRNWVEAPQEKNIYIYLCKNVLKLSYCVFLERQMTAEQQFVADLSITLSLPSGAIIR
jgi:hypothetical protein